MNKNRIRVKIQDAFLQAEEILPPGYDESKPVLVFLHKGLGSIGQWKAFPAELCTAASCRGIVYDRQGHGGSDPFAGERPENFYDKEAGEVLPALLSEFHVDKHILFGHSDGATIALRYATLFPEAALGVISEAAHVVIEDVTIAGIREAARLWKTTDLKTKLSRYHGEKTDDVFHAWADTWLDPVLHDWTMVPLLQKITCPLLLVQGDRDQYGSKAQLDAIAQNTTGPVDVLYITGCGHAPHLEKRREVMASVLEFIGSITI